MTQIFAHRGANKNYPENTMASFIGALEMGVDGIEFDVRLSRDEEVVVIHDSNVDRTTSGKGFISDLTVAQLKQLTIKNDNTGNDIPLFKDVLEWLQFNSLIFNVELKIDVYPQPLLVGKVITDILRFGLSERVIISSFCHETLVRVSEMVPFMATALLYRDRLFMPWKYAHLCNATGLHPQISTITTDIIKKSQANGIAIRPYGIKSVKATKWAIQAGCAGIIVDDPLLAIGIRNDLK